MIRLSLLTLSLALTFSVAACDDDGEDNPNPNACDTSTLTYDNFGKQFFDNFCVECHDSAKSGADRNGATASINFDTLELVKTSISAAKRRAGDATSMPPASAMMTPASQERADLVEWADCGTKN